MGKSSENNRISYKAMPKYPTFEFVSYLNLYELTILTENIHPVRDIYAIWLVSVRAAKTLRTFVNISLSMYGSSSLMSPGR